MNYEVGQVVGDYQVLEILGAGGMGRVYKVRNVISQRIEAMKVLLADLEGQPELTDRFLREIRVVGGLDHPNIAGLLTAQRAGKQVHMLMEFIEGESLDKMMKRGRVPLPDAVRIIRQVLDGLACAHAQGVVHRDIKPPNIMVTPKGDAVLTDFGIAVAGQDQRLTRAGRALGSLFYMSPEQINGDLNIDRRADIYSLGVTLYELVTGRRPFQGDTDFSLLSAHLHQTPPAPNELAPDVPPALSQIVMTALQKDPGARFQTAEAMNTAMSHVFADAGNAAKTVAVAAPPATAAPPSPPPDARAKTVLQQRPQAPAQPPTPPQAPMKQGSGRRLVWLLAGSLATLVVLGVAVTQLPMFQRIWAGPPQKPEIVKPTPPEEPPPSGPTGGIQQPPNPPRGGTGPRTVPPGDSGQPPPGRPPEKPSDPPGVLVIDPPVTIVNRGVPPSPPAIPPAQAAAIRAQQERLNDVGTRTGAIRRTIENLRRANARAGLGIRRDFEMAEQKLIFELDEAEAAIKAGDPEKAEKHLDSAELSLRFLESRLGG